MKSLLSRIQDILDSQKSLALKEIPNQYLWEDDQHRRLGIQLVQRYLETQKVFGLEWHGVTLGDFLNDVEEEEVS